MMKFGKLLMDNKYLKYHVRWQSGFLVCYPCMWLFNGYLNWSIATSVIAFQFVGAVVYYQIDKWIFNKKIEKKEKPMDPEMCPYHGNVMNYHEGSEYLDVPVIYKLDTEGNRIYLVDDMFNVLQKQIEALPSISEETDMYGNKV